MQSVMQLFNYVCIVYHMIVLVGAAQHCDSHATVSSKMSTICSSTWSFIIARGSDTRMMRSCSPLPYLKNARRQIWIEKAFAAVYPVSRAIETPSPLKDSDKASTCTSSSFECSYSQLLLMHNSPLTPQPSAWLSNLHLVIKQGNVLWLDHSVVGQQLCTQLTRPFPPHAEVTWLTRIIHTLRIKSAITYIKIARTWNMQCNANFSLNI